MMNDGTSWKQEIANSQLNKDTDTVAGQLKTHTDFKSPVMQRVAQQAKEAASGRGLGNTTIAQRAATGAVIDKAGEFATKDAELYANRRTENQRAAYSLESTAMGNAASLVAGREKNVNNLEGQALANKGQLDNTILANASRERTAEAERISGDWRAQLTSDTSKDVAAQDNQTKLHQTQIDTASRGSIAQLDNATKITLAREEEQRLRDNVGDTSLDAAWANYQTALSNIDANAKATSQVTQANRIKASFEARLAFLQGGSVGDSIATSLDSIKDPNAPAPTSDPATFSWNF